MSGGRNRQGCGSIRKNSRPLREVDSDSKQCSTQVMTNLNFSLDSREMVTAREEKTLVDKYLKRDYVSRVA